MKSYYVYILTSERNGILYIGITSNLIKRIWEHKSKAISGFTSNYNVGKLVYFEEFQDINLAISKEKLLKSWQRKWKINLIEKQIKNGKIYMMKSYLDSIVKHWNDTICYANYLCTTNVRTAVCHALCFNICTLATPLNRYLNFELGNEGNINYTSFYHCLYFLFTYINILLT